MPPEMVVSFGPSTSNSGGGHHSSHNSHPRSLDRWSYPSNHHRHNFHSRGHPIPASPTGDGTVPTRSSYLRSGRQLHGIDDGSLLMTKIGRLCRPVCTKPVLPVKVTLSKCKFDFTLRRSRRDYQNAYVERPIWISDEKVGFRKT